MSETDIYWFNCTSDLLIQNGTGTGILTSPYVPDWHGEKWFTVWFGIWLSNCKRCDDQATYWLFEINPNGDSGPLLITLFGNELYFAAFNGSSRNLYVSDLYNNNVNSASHVFLHELIVSNCSTDEDPTLKCHENHGIIGWLMMELFISLEMKMILQDIKYGVQMVHKLVH